MKKIIALAMLAVVATGANAKGKKQPKVDPNKPVFTIVKENPITSVKDQNRSGTCWAYSTLSYFESEILKSTGKTYDSARASWPTRTTWTAPYRSSATTATCSSHRVDLPTTFTTC